MVTIEKKATINETGTSTDSFGVGDGSSSKTFFKSFQPGFDPYIAFDPVTGMWVLKTTEDGKEIPIAAAGALYYRPPARVVDLTNTSKPVGANPVIDTVAVSEGDRILFTALTGGESGDNNKVFVITNVATAPLYTLETDGNAGDGTPTEGDCLWIDDGSSPNTDRHWCYNADADEWINIGSLLIEDVIVDGVVDKAPSQNAVFDQMAAHTADEEAHHFRYTDAEARAAAVITGALSSGSESSNIKAPTHDGVIAGIATHTSDAEAHHSKYTDPEALAASVLSGALSGAETSKAATHSSVDTAITSAVSTHTSDAEAHHSKYLDAEALAAAVLSGALSGAETSKSATHSAVDTAISTAVSNHAESSSAHHSKYLDAEALAASVLAGALSGAETSKAATHSAVDSAITTAVSSHAENSSAHHSKYLDAEALAAAVLSGALSGAETSKSATHSAVDTAISTSAGKVAAYVSTAGAGGASTEIMSVTGIAATDTVLAITQDSGTLPVIGWSTLGAAVITIDWGVDPGAGSIVRVLVKHP